MIPVILLWALLLTLCTGVDEQKSSEVQTYTQFEKVKITDIEPQGWIREFLIRQKNGLTGNIEVAGYPFNTCLWACEKMEGSTKAWWPYEQTAYYLDGVHRLGLLLDDQELVQKATINTDYVRDNLEPSGRFGTNLADRWWRWPYASFNRLFMVQQELTDDEEILKILSDHYMTFSAEDFQDDLELANVEQLCWLYGKTGDERFIQMAEQAYELFQSDPENRSRSGKKGTPSDMQFGTDRIPDHHGVVYLELAKVPALLYKYTGKEQYLKEAENALAKMEDNFMLAGGLPSTTEHFETSSEISGYEICNTAVFPYTYGHLMRINGDATLGDNIEKAIFNAGIGSVEKNFKSHQYFSMPNQFLANSTSNPFGHHPARGAFLPGHDVECCTGNVNRFMPYYVEQMWLKTKDDGVVAALYGPGGVRVNVGRNRLPVYIEAQTNYPFSDIINFVINTKQDVKFPLYLRIPEWLKEPMIEVNGKEIEQDIPSGQFYKIERRFSNEDVITLKLPVDITTKRWPNNGISVERGPLVFSLPIMDNRSVLANYEKSTEAFPGWELNPAGSWNYALQEGDMDVTVKETEDYPWDEGASLIRISVPVRKVVNWELASIYDDYFKLESLRTPPFPEELILSDQREMVDLVPYGNTMLRLTVFPYSTNQMQ